MDENRTIRILQHQISYWYDDDQEVPDIEQEHVREMIIKGYSSGELNCLMHDCQTENRGWWHIVKGWS